MPNKRFEKFPSKGASNGKAGPKQDKVGPIKTTNWPGLPGKTQSKPRNAGVKKMHDGLASKGV